MMQIIISDEYVKSVSLEDFKAHFADNGYDWSDTDIAGYWKKFNPTVKAKSAPEHDSDTTKGETHKHKK